MLNDDFAESSRLRSTKSNSIIIFDFRNKLDITCHLKILQASSVMLMNEHRPSGFSSIQKSFHVTKYKHYYVVCTSVCTLYKLISDYILLITMAKIITFDWSFICIENGGVGGSWWNYSPLCHYHLITLIDTLFANFINFVVWTFIISLKSLLFLARYHNQS